MFNKRIKRISFILLIIYFIGPLIVATFQEKFLFISNTSEFWQDISKPYEIFIENDGVKLQGWYLNRPITPDKPLIVFFGGNGQDVALMPSYFKLTFDNALLTFNTRSYGLSEGEPSEANSYSDASFILNEFLASKNISQKDVVVMGLSFGSGIASYVAEHENVKGIIFLLPFDSAALIAKSYFPIYPTFFYEKLLRHPFNNLEKVKNTKTPALFLAADDDWVVWRDNSKRLYQAYAGPKQEFILEGGHFDSGFTIEARDYMKAFMQSLEDDRANE